MVAWTFELSPSDVRNNMVMTCGRRGTQSAKRAENKPTLVEVGLKTGCAVFWDGLRSNDNLQHLHIVLPDLGRTGFDSLMPLRSLALPNLQTLLVTLHYKDMGQLTTTRIQDIDALVARMRASSGGDARGADCPPPATSAFGTTC